MKFIYLTAKHYPGTTADHRYILDLARAFHAERGGDFSFVACNTDQAALGDIPLINVRIPRAFKRSIVFFFWIPWFCLKRSRGGSKLAFFSNDLNLLALLIFWRRVLGLTVDITVDWHMLTGTWKDRFVAGEVDRSIATSDKLARTIRAQAVYAIHGGVSLEVYKKDLSASDKTALRRQLGLPEKGFLAGYVGLWKTLGQEKGIRTMIDALAVPGSASDGFMVFVGGKPDEIAEYAAYAGAKSAHVREHCIFVPLQSSFEQVARYEQALDALVIPYPDTPHYRDYGFPMKIYEYMASGTPIIYTKLELVEEVAADCAYGIVPESPSELSRTIAHIRANPAEAAGLAHVARIKAQAYSWQGKARAILATLDIMAGMPPASSDLAIPNKALKYILFQRTEFSIYQSRRWLIRVAMNRRIPVYNAAIALEATVLPGRTKRLFSADMRREYELIKAHLPAAPHNILDIGCGVAGIDVMLHRHYRGAQGAAHRGPDYYLLDKTEVNSRVYYGLEKTAAYYNSLDIARDMLVGNGVPASHIHVQEVTGGSFFPGVHFDLVISLISWGFHYPVSTYLDQVYEALNPGGTLIIDVRKGTDGEQLIQAKFGGRSSNGAAGQLTLISDAAKHRRILVRKPAKR